MIRNKYYVNIADILIDIETDFNILIGIEGIDFFCNKDKNICRKNDINFEIKKIEKPIQIDGNLFNDDRLYIYDTNYGFVREFYPIIDKNPYAWLIPVNEYKYNLFYLPGREDDFKYSKNVLEAINIEKILNKFNAFILHSSFIKYQDKAMLFTAPSGTGKSNQADLWEKYENAEIINGDRTGIRKMDGKWTAYGLPIAGSSGIYKNKRAEISHIIVLKQGEENKLTQFSPREAFVKLYSETIVHTWDKEFQENIINMITDVVQNVQIYQYECLPDKSAVSFLKEQIIKDRGLVLENNE